MRRTDGHGQKEQPDTDPDVHVARRQIVTTELVMGR